MMHSMHCAKPEAPCPDASLQCRDGQKCRNTGIQPTMTKVSQSSKIALIINSSVVTSNVKEAINYAMKYTPVQTYICQKNNWSLETFQLSDWQSFARYFKSIPMAKRIKVAKLIHGWQNTGAQKEQFARSHHSKDPLNEDECQAISQCSMQCGDSETSLYYLYCKNNPKPEEITRCVQRIARWMKKSGTHKPLIPIIIKAMTNWLVKGKLTLEWKFAQDEDHEGITQALLAEQQQIGWHNFFKGRINKTWTAIQQREYSRQSQYRIDTDDDLTQTLLRKLVGRKPHQASGVHEPKSMANQK